MEVDGGGVQVRSVEMERGLRKQGNKEAADSIAAAQAEVTTLKGQCKGLSSKIIQVQAVLWVFD